MVDTIRPISDLREEKPSAPPQREPEARAQKLFVRLSGREDPLLHRLELLLTMFPGQEPLVIWLEKEQKRIGARCLIHPALVQELRELLGGENVVLK